VQLDGKDYLKWSGPVASLSVNPWMIAHHPDNIGLYAWESEVHFHRVTLKMLDGEVWVREPAKPDVPKPPDK